MTEFWVNRDVTSCVIVRREFDQTGHVLVLDKFWWWSLPCIPETLKSLSSLSLLCNWTFACLGQEFFFSWIQNLRDPPSIKSKHVIRWHVVEADTIKYFSVLFLLLFNLIISANFIARKIKESAMQPETKVISYLFFHFPFSLPSCFPIYTMQTIVYFSFQYYEGRHVGKTYFRSFSIMWVLPEYFVRFFQVICLQI